MGWKMSWHNALAVCTMAEMPAFSSLLAGFHRGPCSHYLFVVSLSVQTKVLTENCYHVLKNVNPFWETAPVYIFSISLHLGCKIGKH